MAASHEEVVLEEIRARIRNMDANIEHMRTMNRKLDAEMAMMQAETTKAGAQTDKLRQENRWYLLVVGSGATLAIVAFAKLFL